MKYLLVLTTFFIIAPLQASAQRADIFLSDSNTTKTVEGELGRTSEETHYGSYASEMREKKKKAQAALVYRGATAELPGLEKQMEEQENFKGPIERLLKAAGEDPSSAQNNWRDFESISQNEEAKQSYFETADWKMRQEFSRPIAKRKVFGDRLSDVESSIRNLNKKEKDLEQQYGEKSKWAPSR